MMPMFLILLVPIAAAVLLAITAGPVARIPRSDILRRLGSVILWSSFVWAVLVMLLAAFTPADNIVRELAWLVLVGSIVALFLRAWIRELVFLMSLGDDAFPGRYDKPVWALMLLMIPPLGLIVFRRFRHAHGLADPKPATARVEWD